MPTEAAVGLHGKLKVNQCAFVNPGKRSACPCLWGEVGAKRFRLYVQRGEANPADRHTVSGPQLFGSSLRCDGDTAVLAALLDLGYRTDFFNDSSEHGFTHYRDS